MTGPPVTRNLTPAFFRHRDRRQSKISAKGHSFGGAVADPLLDVELGKKGVELTTVLPPRWVDAAESAREEIRQLKGKLVQLQKAQSKRLLRVFSDDPAQDREALWQSRRDYECD
eukprot:Skav230518  [mRNA]  locus=scaffold4943:98402:101160:+ [translate_table: standard]